MKKGSLINSFKYAFQGIYCNLKTERNLKIHFIASILVIILGFIFSISLYEWISIYASVKFVISIYFNARHKEHWELLQSGSCVLLMCDHLFFF